MTVTAPSDRFVFALAWTLAACARSPDDAAKATASVSVAPTAKAESVEPPASSTTAAAIASAAPTEHRCLAPVLGLSSAIDAYDERALDHCERLERGKKKCGTGKDLRLDVARFEASVPPIDAATEERIVKVAERGKALGRNAHAFGLVGDSITVSRDFMTDLGARSIRPMVIDPALRPLLALADGSSIVDWYRGHAVETYAGHPLDSFEAERAAKVGARASFAIAFGDASPVAKLVDHIQPAIAIVSFGANDAAYRPAPSAELVAQFEKNLLGVVDALEARGVVVIVEDEMRHGDQPGVKACPSDDVWYNDWRTAVLTNAIVRRTAEIACREHLPFADVRYAMDASSLHGLGPDSVHPNAHADGAARFDAQGLDCGFNVRNLVTLAALADVVEVLQRRGVF